MNERESMANYSIRRDHFIKLNLRVQGTAQWNLF
jgi:hypothetical protein